MNLTVVRSNIEKAIGEMALVHKERLDIIQTMWVAMIGGQHVLLLGPGGTGKSFVSRDGSSRVTGAKYFEMAVDETSDPGQLVGPQDVVGMKDRFVVDGVPHGNWVDAMAHARMLSDGDDQLAMKMITYVRGRYQRITKGMAPEAHFWFIDEFFNANGPFLHLMLPMLQERKFQNNDPEGDGKPMPIPLWTMFAGTNKLNADADQAALWDRVHLRTTVRYVRDHDNILDLVKAGVKRRISGWTEPEKTTITFDELVAAHDAAMQLPVPQATAEAFIRLHDELATAGIEVSTRRIEEGWVAAASNAWRKGHEQVEIVDLDILTHMWWALQADEEKARKIILGNTNPGEKAALELLDSLDKDRAQLNELKDSGADRAKVARMAMEIYKNCSKYMAQAEQLLEKAEAAGSSTVRIMELTGRAKKLQNDVQSEVFDA